MEPHMIENELFSYVFVLGINHVGFMVYFIINYLVLNGHSFFLLPARTQPISNSCRFGSIASWLT